LRFDFVFGVGLGDGVCEAFFCFGEAAGDGVGVAFFDERFRCLRAGVGVGSGSKAFLIFVPNDSSAASAASIAPTSIETIKKPRHIVWKTTKLVGRFCETPSGSASDTDALQSARRFLVAMG
jgi:hypothetical protein